MRWITLFVNLLFVSLYLSIIFLYIPAFIPLPYLVTIFATLRIFTFSENKQKGLKVVGRSEGISHLEQQGSCFFLLGLFIENYFAYTWSLHSQLSVSTVKVLYFRHLCYNSSLGINCISSQKSVQICRLTAVNIL